MVEIYLFVHPLCSECLASEQRIVQMVYAEQKKVQFKFVPLLNLQSFHRFLTDHKLQGVSLHKRNQLFKDSYAAALDYKAMQFQGKKIGRALLFALQEAVCTFNITYSKELVEQLVKEIGGDLVMFRSDRQSKLVEKAFTSDQQTALEMSVTKDAAAVVFNYACERDFGVLTGEHPSADILAKLI